MLYIIRYYNYNSASQNKTSW